MKNTTILIIDDFSLLRQALGSFLSSQEQFSIVGETADQPKAFGIMALSMPDLVLFDTPFSSSGPIETHDKIKHMAPQTKTIHIPLKVRAFPIKKMLDQRLNGCISKHASLDELVHGILTVMKKGIYFCDHTKQELLDYRLQIASGRANIDQLSVRELQVAELLASGKTSREVSEDLDIAIKTVEVHRYRILKKLQLKNTSALVNLLNR